MVGLLKSRTIRPGLALSLLGLLGLLTLLGACTTAPSSPGRPAPGPLTRITPVPVPPGLAEADTPTDAVPQPPGFSSDLPRPALLGNEPAREFERGAASWYGAGFHGRLTASGERYDMNAFTAAHRTLPFGTLVRVHSLVNGRDVDLRITDRGPFSRNRIIDVSRAAAAELGMLGQGFKEVVLLVPESTPITATAAPPAVRKSPRRTGRTPVARRR